MVSEPTERGYIHTRRNTITHTLSLPSSSFIVFIPIVSTPTPHRHPRSFPPPYRDPRSPFSTSQTSRHHLTSLTPSLPPSRTSAFLPGPQKTRSHLISSPLHLHLPLDSQGCFKYSQSPSSSSPAETRSHRPRTSTHHHRRCRCYWPHASSALRQPSPLS